MAKVTEEIKEVMKKAKGFALATCTKDGDPHVVPIALGKLLSDEELLLVDVFMKKSLENLKENPTVAVTFWDLESLKGYEFKGKARLETSGPAFEEAMKLVKKVLPQLDTKGALVIKIESIFIRTPGPDAGKELV